MNTFGIITQPGSVPQGKPKVFFICHEQEYRELLPSVAQDILNCCDCAIYYCRPGSKPGREDLDMLLDSVSLVVVAVSRKYLTSPDSFAEQIVQNARKNLTPVLPIVFQSGLETLFNQRFGELQFLNRFKKDDTELDYADKLKKYLNFLLLNEETANLIRQEFNACIFLSYRKKDRKLARSLMKHIHSNKHLRDVAIWFDEFLTPGEDFNQEIEDKLKKSDMFLLTVTPNLVNRKNYIQKIEYPIAHNCKKKIVPAGMKKLSWLKSIRFQRIFKNCPPILDGNDINLISGAVKDCLDAEKLTRKKDDPVHCYRIGLAYMNGLDVETDHARAADLITYAAKRDVADAAEQLATMYRYAQGVEQNYGEAVLWYQRHLALIKKKFAESGKEADGMSVAAASYSLGDFLMDLSRVDEAEELYLNMVQDLEKVTFNYAFFYKCTARAGLAMIALSRKHYDDAEAQLISLIKSYEKTFILSIEAKKVQKVGGQLPLDASVIDSFLVHFGINIARAYIKLIKIATEQQDEEKAEKYRQLLEGTTTLLQEAGSVSNVDKAEAEMESIIDADYEQLAMQAGQRGDLKTAREYAQKILNIREKQYREGTNKEAMHNIFAIYQLFGIIEANDHNLKKSKEWFLKAYDMAQKLYKERPTPENQRNVTAATNDLDKINYLLSNRK